MTDLVEFLRARLAEDEARVVRDSSGHVGDRTARDLHTFRHDIKSGELGDLMLNRADPDDRSVPWMVATELENIADGFWMDWMDRAVREVEAKRQILEDCEAGLSGAGEFSGPAGKYADYLARRQLRSLAAVYSDHPDYDPAWSR